MYPRNVSYLDADTMSCLKLEADKWLCCTVLTPRGQNNSVSAVNFMRVTSFTDRTYSCHEVK